MKDFKKLGFLSAIIILLFACSFPNTREKPVNNLIPTSTAGAQVTSTQIVNIDNDATSTSVPTYTHEKLTPDGNYQLQSGDTAAALAMRFKVPIEDIFTRNSTILTDPAISTLPPYEWIQIEIPQEFQKLPVYRVFPDTLFVYGPSQADFDLERFVADFPGWLKTYIDDSSGNSVEGTKILQLTAENYSISPKLLLALIEYHLHGLSDPNSPVSFNLGNSEPNRKTFGRQLSWAANILNNGYYGWREGVQTEFYDIKGDFFRPHPANNAGTVALQYYFSQFQSISESEQTISNNGFLAVYENLFGNIDPLFDQMIEQMPTNLRQPELKLPLQENVKWSFSGGPHSGWGVGYPYAAIDFAPPSTQAGCDTSPYWISAAADGIVSRIDDGILMLDLDNDGSARTGWNLLYVHLSPVKRFYLGDKIQQGDLLGHPACLAGNSSGRNVHIARLYNGEWIPSGGVIPLQLGDWTTLYGEKEYKGSLVNGEKEIRSSSNGEWFSQMTISK